MKSPLFAANGEKGKVSFKSRKLSPFTCVATIKRRGGAEAGEPPALISTANDQQACFIWHPAPPSLELPVQIILTQLHMLEPVTTATGGKRAPASRKTLTLNGDGYTLHWV